MLVSRVDACQPLAIIPCEPMSEICLCSCCHTAGLALGLYQPDSEWWREIAHQICSTFPVRSQVPGGQQRFVLRQQSRGGGGGSISPTNMK